MQPTTEKPDTSRIALLKRCSRAAGASVMVIGCLVLAGWAFDALTLNSLFTLEFGILLIVLLGTANLVVLIGWNARLLARLDAERKHAEQALAERERLAAFSVDVSLALTQCHTLEETLRRCAEVLVRHFDAALVQIWTLDPPGNVLELTASAGLTVPAMESCQPVPVGKEKIDLIVQSCQPLISYEVIGDESSRNRTAAQQAGLIGFAGYPLIVEDHLVGVLAMFARRPFSSAAIQAMTSVSNGVALGIERKRAEESLRERATHDPLTGLWNRSAILDLLRRELARASRSAMPISLVMVDLDHFKRVNDERGHLVGDVVLQCAGQKMASLSRPYDMIGRYGGEEFVIVLPGCDTPDAVLVAERIRRLIDRDALETPVGPVSVTVSMGVAGLAQINDASADALIRAADAALYRAKKLGRNRVEVAPRSAMPAQLVPYGTPAICTASQSA